MQEYIVKVVRQAGFRSAGSQWMLNRGPQQMHCRIGMRKNNQVSSVAWWIDLEQAQPHHVRPADAGAYRAGALPADARPVLAAPVSITLRDEDAIDGLGKSLALNRELTFDDAEFDDAVYIESDGDDDSVRQTLADPAFRSAVLELLREGAMVRVNARRGQLIVERDSLLNYLDASDVRRLANALFRAHAALPLFAATTRTETSGQNTFERTGLALIGVALVGFFLGIGSVEGDKLMVVANVFAYQAIAATGAVIFLALVHRWVAHSNSNAGLRHFSEVAIPGLASWLLWLWAILSWLQ